MPLYLVATPIGNLGDLSPRARETLEKANVLAAEDTRSARRLMQLLNIPCSAEVLSYGDHNEHTMAPKLAERLKSGLDVAVLSEGGTPLVSDPGYRLVQAAIESGVPVIPIPGPCAAIAALSASGLPVHGFIYKGFLSKKSGTRRRVIEGLKEREETLIFYESPQRVGILLGDLLELLGPERLACIAREMTKLHETFLRGSLKDLSERWQAEEAKGPHGMVRGECTVLVAGKTDSPRSHGDTEND